MREVTPIERAICTIERFQRELDLIKAELCAYLPDDDKPVKNWITDPFTGERLYFKRNGSEE
jgi:hypothetical protein